MTAHRLTTWLLVILIASALSMAYLLDGTPTEAQATHDNLHDLVDAQRDAYLQQRFVRAAQKACEGRGTAQLLADNSIQCSGITIAKVAL